MVVARGQRAHVDKSGEDHRQDAGFGPAGDHDVGVVAQHGLERFANGVAAGGARAGNCHVRPLSADGDCHQSRRGVRQKVRQEHRRDSVRAALEQHLLLAEHPLEPTRSGTEDDADTLGALAGDVECGVGHGLFGRDQGELRAAVHVAQFFGRDDRLGLELLYLTADLDAEGARIEQGQGVDAGAAGEQV